MNPMVATVAALTVLSALNLFLTATVLRRHATPGGSLGAGHADFDPDAAVAGLVGRQVPDFTATTSEGGSVSGAELAGRHVLVGFFSTTCTACLDEAPGFAFRVTAAGYSRSDVLVVVDGDRAQAGPLLGVLEPVATVVVEPEFGPIAQGFGVIGFPLFFHVAFGTVARATLSLAELGDLRELRT